MTSISHALIGASIAARIGNPYLAGTTALITHFVCDAIPHWDLGTNWRGRRRLITGLMAIAETIFAITATYFIFRNFVNPNVLLISIFFSLVPDWAEIPYYVMLPNPPKIFYYIYKAQNFFHSKLTHPEGIITQVLVVIAFLAVGFLI